MQHCPGKAGEGLDKVLAVPLAGNGRRKETSKSLAQGLQRARPRERLRKDLLLRSSSLKLDRTMNTARAHAEMFMGLLCTRHARQKDDSTSRWRQAGNRTGEQNENNLISTNAGEVGASRHPEDARAVVRA